MAERFVSKETIKTTLLRWWNLDETFSFKILGENLFLIEFTNVTDKKRVLEGRRWVFEGSLFLIEDFDGSTSASKFTFEKVAFWIRMMDLPLACMGRETGKMLGSSVGIMEAVDTNGRGIGWREFLRVQIQIDLTKLLARGRMLKFQRNTKWIPFQYERLPKFCFNCGVIIHGRAGCPNRSMMKQQSQPAQFGLWMQAPSPPKRTERGNGRTIPKKGSLYPEYTGGEAPQSRPATR